MWLFNLQPGVGYLDMRDRSGSPTHTGESAMQLIKKAGAWSNGEVAYLAWKVDGKIDNCLGFMITRVHETGGDAGQHRILPTWISFDDQSNPDWNAQDASVWPIQAYEWRDLTLRKSRETTVIRPINFRVHYEIVPVGPAGRGRTLIPPSDTAPYKDAKGKPLYAGKPRPLYRIGEPIKTNTIDVTHDYDGKKAKIQATFTNGILSTQFLRRQLEAVEKKMAPEATRAVEAAKKKGKPAKPAESHLLKTLKLEIGNPKSDIRGFLTGDALSFLKQLLERAGKENGAIYLALYELHDPELIGLLEKYAKQGRVHIILSTAGTYKPKNQKGVSPKKRLPAIFDTENDEARRALHAIKNCDIQDRMFNKSGPIGHNKFAVLVTGKGKAAKPVAVMSGSTNWTETGLCAQSNNAIIIDDENVAQTYLDYWHRLEKDKQPKRVPLRAVDAKGKPVPDDNGKPIRGAAGNNANQGAEFRISNMKGSEPAKLGDGKTSVELWFSPNTKVATKNATSKTPPDLAYVYDLMDKASDAIFFLSFFPGQSGKQDIIGEAARLAQRKKDLFVMGAISEPKALPNYLGKSKEDPTVETYIGADGKRKSLPARAIWWPEGEKSRIAMIRAAAVRIPVGNLKPELLTAGHAIIHDKIIVIDPLDEKNCTVVTGSHNLGFKASYGNDENMMIIRGNRALAISYAVHVIDIYDHYLFRARIEEDLRNQLKAGKIKSFAEAASKEPPHGFLRTDPDWQDKQLAAAPDSSLNYFLAKM
jgi:hypothetical protein